MDASIGSLRSLVDRFVGENKYFCAVFFCTSVRRSPEAHAAVAGGAMSRRLTIVGWRQLVDFQKCANVAAALEHLYPQRIKAEIVEFENEAQMKAWLPSALAKVRGAPTADRAPSTVAAWADDAWIGSTDEALAFARSEFGSTARPNPPQARPEATDGPDSAQYAFDLLVIGGGSGGLACAKRAAKHGAKVALLDFVKPSWAGSTWGLGGTCVNVGCIPKKLMHQSALLGEHMHDAVAYGWDAAEHAKMDWETLRQAVQDHIGSLNWGYRVQLREQGVKYVNKLGRFVGPHEVEAKDKTGNIELITARRIVIAVGGRPRPLHVPGDELTISSDDLFALKKAPGKTLVVGASYVALECAGFLTAFGMDTTVMVRSILLRGFDRDCADKIGDFMQEAGTKFIRDAAPTRLEKTADGRIKVFWGSDGSDVFDTVVVAVGRDADVKGLDVAAAGVAVTSGKLACEHERTNVEHIYAIGDVVLGAPELTPVAIEAGKLLADRLYAGATEAIDYTNVCTTVFTPLEYGCCGLSEEAARERVGDDHLEVYHSHFTPLEWTVPHRPDNKGYCKVLVDLSDNERVLGMHFLGPSAGEVMQGFGVGMKMGMTFRDLTRTVGIHPTAAEELTKLDVTKRSGLSSLRTGC